MNPAHPRRKLRRTPARMPEPDSCPAPIMPTRTPLLHARDANANCQPPPAQEPPCRPPLPKQYVRYILHGTTHTWGGEVLGRVRGIYETHFLPLTLANTSPHRVYNSVETGSICLTYFQLAAASGMAVLVRPCWLGLRLIRIGRTLLFRRLPFRIRHLTLPLLWPANRQCAANDFFGTLIFTGA